MKRISVLFMLAMMVLAGIGCEGEATPSPTAIAPMPAVTAAATTVPTASAPTPYPTPFPEARRQHYRFAHFAMPSLFHSDPARFIQSLDEQGNAFLLRAWVNVGVDLQGQDLVDPAGLRYDIREFEEDGMTIVLVTLPPPQAITEAYFVALVYCTKGIGLCIEQGSPTAVITLEYNWVTGDKPITIVGEWMPDGSHRNYGVGPEPTPEAFLAAVRKILETGRLDG